MSNPVGKVASIAKSFIPSAGSFGKVLGVLLISVAAVNFLAPVEWRKRIAAMFTIKTT